MATRRAIVKCSTDILGKGLQSFWGILSQKNGGRSDTHFNEIRDALIKMFRSLGVPPQYIYTELTMAGYYEPSKTEDLVIAWPGVMFVIIELKSITASQAAKNFRNRIEEMMSLAGRRAAWHNGCYTTTAPKQSQLPAPFLSYFIVVEDAPQTMTVSNSEASQRARAKWADEFRTLPLAEVIKLAGDRAQADGLLDSFGLICSARNGNPTPTASAALATYLEGLARHIESSSVAARIRHVPTNTPAAKP